MQAGFVPLAFLAGLPWAKILAGIAIAIALAMIYRSIYKSGYKAGEALLTAYVASQAAETAKTQIEIEKVVTKVETVYVDRIVKVKEKGDAIVQTVREYVTVPDDAACELRVGFVRQHDAAATNTPAAPPGDADREPSGVALSEALQAVAVNYLAAHQWREQALGCRAFYDKIRAKVNR